jgi:hypothetical protein
VRIIDLIYNTLITTPQQHMVASIAQYLRQGATPLACT